MALSSDIWPSGTRLGRIEESTEYRKYADEDEILKYNTCECKNIFRSTKRYEKSQAAWVKKSPKLNQIQWSVEWCLVGTH